MLFHILMRIDRATLRLIPRKNMPKIKVPKIMDREELNTTVGQPHKKFMIRTEMRELSGTDFVKLLTPRLKPAKQSLHVHVQDSVGKTVIHKATIELDTQSLSAIMEKMKPEDKLKSLQMQDHYGNTALHYAVTLGRNDLVEIMLADIPDSFALFGIRNNCGETVLHCSAIYGTKETTEYMLQNMSRKQFCDLVFSKDKINQTVLEGAEACSKRATAQMLRDAIIDSAIAEDNLSEKAHLISYLSEWHPLTAAQAYRLSKHSDCYVIPKHQDGARIYGLVLYNVDRRSGAVREANAIEEALQRYSCDAVRRVEWSTEQDLREIITLHLQDIEEAADCALLMVFIMSHGTLGALSASDGGSIPINNILHQCSQILNKDTPMAMVVQACQVFNVAERDESMTIHDMPEIALSDAQSNKHIVLRRPNTLLIMAIAGSTLVRGAYIVALAEEMEQADGLKCLRDMHQGACRSVNKHFPDQIMELRETLSGKIVLPLSTIKVEQRIF